MNKDDGVRQSLQLYIIDKGTGISAKRCDELQDFLVGRVQEYFGSL